MQVGDAPIIVFFVFFPPFATAGNWKGLHRILPLPLSFASLIIAGVIEIRIKRVGVEVEVRGSGGVGVWGGGGRGGMHEWRKIQKTMSTILKRSVFLLRSTSFYSLLLLQLLLLLQFFSRDEASEAVKYTSCLFVWSKILLCIYIN